MGIFGVVLAGALFIKECPYPDEKCEYKKHAEPHTHSEQYPVMVPRLNNNMVAASTADAEVFDSPRILMVTADPDDPEKKVLWADVSNEST
jgi:hypothetical protein